MNTDLIATKDAKSAENRSEPSLTEKSIPELCIDSAELEILRQRLAAELMALQSQLSEINAACSARLPQKEYHRLQSQRGQVVKQIAEKQRELAELKAARVEVGAVLTVRRSQSFGRDDIKELVAIRDRWHDFSMDKANHQKAREAAWKFSQELRALLKPIFQATDER